VTPAGYGLAIAPGTSEHEHICTQHAENSTMQVSSSRKSSGASCDIRDYEGARRTRQRARRVREGRRGRREGDRTKRMEGTGLARCGARPGVGLISRCFPLFLSRLLAYSLLLGTCNLIVSDLTFDASKQPLFFVGRSRDHGVNKR